VRRCRHGRVEDLSHSKLTITSRNQLHAALSYTTAIPQPENRRVPLRPVGWSLIRSGIAGDAAHAAAGRQPSKALDYRSRNVIERRLCHLKQWRGSATRYDRLATVYRAATVINAVIAWTQHLSDTL